MAALGSGLGGFLDGFVKGAEARRKINKQESDAEIDREKLGLLKNADRRAQESHTQGLDLSRSQEGRAASADRRSQESHELSLKASQAQLDEYGANAPVREAARRRQLAEEGNKLGAAEDQSAIRDERRRAVAATERETAELGKSIMNTTDAEGKPTFTIDGEVYATREQAMARIDQKHGTFADRFRKNYAPLIEKKYIEAGDTEGAELWNKWARAGTTRQAINDIGRLLQAREIGDFSRANSALKSLANNYEYVPRIGFDISIAPINEGGKEVGARIVYKDTTSGTEHAKDFRDISEMTDALMGMVDPSSIFSRIRAANDQANATKVEQAKDNHKTANEILKEQARSDNTIDLKRFESALKANEAKYGAADPKEIFNAIKTLRDANRDFFKKPGPDGKPVDMTLEEVVEKTLAATAGIRARAPRPAPQQAQPATPASRVLMSRPQIQQQPTPSQLGVPAPRPVVPRSVLPVIQGF